MRTLIEANLTKPTNVKMAKEINVDESSIRNWKKNKPEHFEKVLFDYRMKNAPFVPFSQFKENFETEYTEADILNGTIPGLLNSIGQVLSQKQVKVLNNLIETLKGKIKVLSKEEVEELNDLMRILNTNGKILSKEQVKKLKLLTEILNIKSEVLSKVELEELNDLIEILDNNRQVLTPVNLEDIVSFIEQIRSFGESNVISLANFKGGVGKSTTAINLATVLSFYGFKVLLVDFDIQGNTTSMFDLYRYKKIAGTVDLKINKIEELYDLDSSDFNHTIVDLIAEVENDNIEEMVKDGVINLNNKTKTIGQFDILPNASNIENALKFEDIDKHLKTYGNVNQALDEVISFVKSDYDFVIIDTPPTISLPLRMSVLATDYFILALTPDKMAKDGIAPFLVPIEMNRKTYKKLKGKDIVVLGGILNRYQKNVNIQRTNKKGINEDLLYNTENTNLGSSTLFEQVIKQDNVLSESQYDMGSVLLYNPTHELVRDYFNLTDEILERIIIDKYAQKQ